MKMKCSKYFKFINIITKYGSVWYIYHVYLPFYAIVGTVEIPWLYICIVRTESVEKTYILIDHFEKKCRWHPKKDVIMILYTSFLWAELTN